MPFEEEYKEYKEYKLTEREKKQKEEIMKGILAMEGAMEGKEEIPIRIERQGKVYFSQEKLKQCEEINEKIKERNDLIKKLRSINKILIKPNFDLYEINVVKEKVIKIIRNEEKEIIKLKEEKKDCSPRKI